MFACNQLNVPMLLPHCSTEMPIAILTIALPQIATEEYSCMSFAFSLEGIMVLLRCDLLSWMLQYEASLLIRPESSRPKDRLCCC